MSTEKTDGYLYEIVGGPSKEDLFDSLRLYNERREVKFTARRINQRDKPSDFFVVIGLIQAESGDGQSWIFEAYLSEGSFSRVKGYYNTSGRHGTFRLLY